jgi:protein-S-isoprenylcysteine O-methyltransferase Ste14
MRKPPLSLLVAYVLFGAFMFLESALRQGNEARTSLAGEEDQGTTRFLGATYGAGVLCMPIFAVVRGRRRVPAFCGPAVMVMAITLRAWAAVTLGRFYTRTLRTISGQPVVRTGPYRFVRHPGYLGTLLMWLGFGLSTRDWLTGALSAGVMLLMYWRRIEAEEAMLQQDLGQAYQAYMAHTPRLIPGLPTPTFLTQKRPLL